MRKNVEWNWEELPAGSSRVKVYGGWIVVVNNAPVFITDKDHVWEVVPYEEQKPAEKEEWEK